jgi:citrate lyase subunit beta/citryl-CoA lyase
MKRSLLFVPGDSPSKIDKALACEADALILDLEDSVAPSAKAKAREVVADALAARASGASQGPILLVRVNPLGGGLTDADLDAVVKPGLAGVVLPKAEGGVSVQHLAAKIAVREAESDLPDGSIAILPIATETARGVFQMGTYAGSSRRLMGVTWGGEDLSADIGAVANRLTDGSYADPYRLARALTLLGAASADVDAIDSVFTAYRDDAGLAAECAAAVRDGFVAKMAIHPAQAAIINAAFQPSDEAISQARRIVAAFAAAPNAGVIGLDGQMLDMPHLKRAERLLKRVG